MTKKTTITKPPIRWVGNKIKHIDWLKSLFPQPNEVERFFDCCGGSGVVAFNMADVYKRVLYNDIYDEVVDFYRVLRDSEQRASLIQKLRLTPYSRSEHTLALEKGHPDPVEKARRFFVRIGQGFNSSEASTSWKICRNHFENLPKAFANAVEYLNDFAIRIRLNVEFENRPVEDIIKRYSHPRNVLYIDPPYIQSVRQNGKASKQYTADASSFEWHQNLAKMLCECDSKVAVSAYVSDDYAALFDGWHRFDSDIYQTRLNGSSDGKIRQEMLLTNYLPVGKSKQKSLL